MKTNTMENNMFRLSRLLVAVLITMVLFSASTHAALIFNNDDSIFNSEISFASSDSFDDLGVVANSVHSLGNSITRGDFTYSTGGTDPLVGLGMGYAGLTTVGIAPNTYDNYLNINFAGTYNAFGFEYTSINDGTLNISIFDLFDNLLGSTDVASSASSMTFFGVFSDVAIGRILLDDGDVGGPIIDNVVAGTANVPEPSMFAILLFGLIGLVTHRLKK
jgi:hypothetical protein